MNAGQLLTFLMRQRLERGSEFLAYQIEIEIAQDNMLLAKQESLPKHIDATQATLDEHLT